MNQKDWAFEDEEDFGVALSQRTEELYSVPNRDVDDEGLIEAWAVPLRDLVIFPRMVSPIFVGREASLLAIQEAQLNNQTVIGLTQHDADLDTPGIDDFLPIGVEMAVGRLLSMPEGASSSLVQGRRRVEIVEFIQLEPFLRVRARPIAEPKDADRETKALMRSVLDSFDRCVHLDRALPDEAYLYALNINEPGWLADMIASTLAIGSLEKQKLLIIPDPAARLQRLNFLLAQEVDVLELEDKIHSRVQSEMSQNQRDFYLREQLKAIQTELGEGDIWTQDVAELREKIKKAKLPKEAQETALKELARLEQMPPMAPEVGIIRTYIDWIVDLPWKKASKDKLDVSHAAKILDRDHYGLKKVKDRILEYIAVRSLKPKKERQPILCFVGAPGTGKTSLGRSIAEALGREFARVSLGGVRDVSEIRGHRRTYIGALPGRIIQTLKRAGKANPLFMLDEIDKLGSDFRGDPSSALLEVLDPEQNHAFSDHYLEIPFDLSKVMFITTANSLHDIPDALLDRMEVIEFPGYIEEEKLAIANQYLISRQIDESGVHDLDLRFSLGALQSIIRQYTYEAGVRNLEREIGRVCRKVARLKAEEKRYPQQITSRTIEKFLGPPEYFLPEAEEQDEVGVATGLAWTMNGGEIMSIEVAVLEGKGNLQITGNIGDVMQESVQAGLTYIKSRAVEYDIPLEVFDRMDIHLHLPEAAIPKDGPSAGITLTSALLSALTGHPVYRDVAMTGEITLRGRVLPVGGVRDKVLAAHRSEMKVVMLPEKNMKDLVDIPKSARNDLKIIPVKHMDQVLEIALAPEQTLDPPRPKEKEEEE
ncbi:MAG: endopeptidase La [Anaerolineae bacterium]|jgi:ATP-dependent Lon protease|nr:endopeptidase La [Anaerolineae bacterium]MBT4312359.1 endopeptidase La [Anaerolineae bacterium]MBT4457327.1 endopeptidase La [Anaerolineae bacterium]MBT6060260.1 endopeptidase La [Anaerolineae bacterium]MBT6322058.1 endopeptidase La [Anaerolineae bacterium]